MEIVDLKRTVRTDPASTEVMIDDPCSGLSASDFGSVIDTCVWLRSSGGMKPVASSGTSLPIIGRVLNHKTPEATKVYARLIVAPVRNAMEEATAAMRKIGEQ